MSIFKKVPILAIVAIILLVISGILQLIALATPYWHITYTRTHGRVGHAGLWNGCQLMIYVIYCSAPAVIPGWLMAVRILEVVGMMFMSGALMMMVIFVVVAARSVKWSNIARNSAAASALVAGLLSLIGAIVYGISVKKSTDVLYLPRTSALSFLTTYYHRLSWGFGLSIAAAILVVISGVIMGFAKRPQQ